MHTTAFISHLYIHAHLIIKFLREKGWWGSQMSILQFWVYLCVNWERERESELDLDHKKRQYRVLLYSIPNFPGSDFFYPPWWKLISWDPLNHSLDISIENWNFLSIKTIAFRTNHKNLRMYYGTNIVHWVLATIKFLLFGHAAVICFAI